MPFITASMLLTRETLFSLRVYSILSNSRLATVPYTLIRSKVLQLIR